MAWICMDGMVDEIYIDLVDSLVPLIYIDLLVHHNLCRPKGWAEYDHTGNNVVLVCTGNSFW